MEGESGTDCKSRISIESTGDALGGDGTTTTEVTDATPQSKVGEIALVLSHRQLFGDAGAVVVDTARLR